MTQLVVPSLSLLIAAPEGRSELPLVELDKAKVKAKRRHVQLREGSKHREKADCSYGSYGNTLRFSAWEMCHAAKKTELTRTFAQQRADQLALLFAHEHHDHFIWDSQNLRCVDGSGMWLEDFSGTGLAGRVGEALAYLTMVKLWGYVYWDRIASVWLRAARGRQIEHQDMVQAARYTGHLDGSAPTPQPDFVFEKPDRTASLMEAKGSFVTPGNKHPDVKNELKHGLEQLDAWSSLIAPSPSSCIAIGSLLREASDPCDDPSLIVHVDPPPTERPGIAPIEVPLDAVRRGNYGAWLKEMGFRRGGRALADRREVETRAIELPVVTLNGRDFALSIKGWRVDDHWPVPFPWWPIELIHVPPRHRFEFLREIGITGVYAAGLEVATLRAVCKALGSTSSAALMDLQPVMDWLERDAREAEGFYGSIMPDGSLLGIVSSRHLRRDAKMETFKL